MVSLSLGHEGSCILLSTERDAALLTTYGTIKSLHVCALDWDAGRFMAPEILALLQNAQPGRTINIVNAPALSADTLFKADAFVCGCVRFAVLRETSLPTQAATYVEGACVVNERIQRLSIFS